MAYTGSMSTGELCGIIKRSNPGFHFTCWRGIDYKMVGVCYEGEHLTSISRCGTLPPRTIQGPNSVIVCRGWRDILAEVYHLGHVRRTEELVRFMGEKALTIIDHTNSYFLRRDMDWPENVVLKEDENRIEWLPQ